VAEDLSSITEAEVRQIIEVIDRLQNSAFDYLQIEIGNLKIVLGKGEPAEYLRTGTQPAPAPAPQPPPPPPAAAAQASPISVSPPVQEPAVAAQPTVSLAEDVIEISAPMVGIYYAQSAPDAPPFVAVGAHVSPDMTVALVEVMKMFNAVPAGVDGTVVEVLVSNLDVVEYGQPLIRVRVS
jgi:acetyl-CoA carboxylase biotin carboxyl carrier protein